MLLPFRLRACVPASRVSPSRGEARRSEGVGGRGFAEQQTRGGEEYASCVIAVSGGSEWMQTWCATDADAGAAADSPDHSRTCLVQCTRPVRHYPAASLRLLCEQRDPDRLRITLRHGTSCLKGQIARVKHPLALNCLVLPVRRYLLHVMHLVRRTTTKRCLPSFPDMTQRHTERAVEWGWLSKLDAGRSRGRRWQLWSATAGMPRKEPRPADALASSIPARPLPAAAPFQHFTTEPSGAVT